jgi:hypothetical protein
MTWPSRVPWIRAKVTKARLAALSINSTPMKTMIALRRSQHRGRPDREQRDRR